MSMLKKSLTTEKRPGKNWLSIADQPVFDRKFDNKHTCTVRSWWNPIILKCISCGTVSSDLQEHWHLAGNCFGTESTTVEWRYCVSVNHSEILKKLQYARRSACYCSPRYTTPVQWHHTMSPNGLSLSEASVPQRKQPMSPPNCRPSHQLQWIPTNTEPCNDDCVWCRTELW